MTDIVNIGFGNIVMTSRIVAIVTPDSAPIKRLIADARTTKRLIDATYGRRTRSVFIMDNNTIILSTITPETIGMRAVEGDASKMKSERQRPIEEKS